MRNRKFLATFSLSVLVAAATVFCSIPVQAAELSQAKSAAQIKYGTVSASDQALLKGMFDYEYYKKTNPDVVAAFGEDANALFNHFLLCGLFEGRCASAAFNPSAYASAYTDLQAAFGTDILSYYRHFALFGANEARPITTLKAAAEAGITVTSLADSNVVITPAIYKLAEKTGNTDLASLQAIATSAAKATASSGGGSSSTPSYSGGGSSSSSSSSGSSEEAEPVAVSSVALNMSSTNIKVGTTKKLSATVEPSDATNKSVTWSSSNGEIVTVAEDGTITAVAVSDAPVTITVTTIDGSKTATCTVTVVDEEVAATGVSVDKSTSTLKVGGIDTLVATVTPSNSTDDVVWSTSDSTKATVLNGKVTAIAETTDDPVTISATVGEFHADCAYTISAPDISTVAIDGSSLSVAKGSSLNLTATVTTDPAGAPASYKAVKWSIPDTTGISINETTGELSVTSEATATSIEVTATSTIDDTKSASKTVSITEPPIAAEDITLDKDKLTVAKGATSEALVATLLPAGANSAITWETSDNTVATVSNGVVTGVGAGEANIVAISGDVSSGACVVTVPGIKVNSTADQLKITKSGDADANTVTIDAGAYGGGELTWTIKSGSEDKITLEDGVVSLKEGYTTTGESTATVVGSTTPTDSDTAITIDVDITITISE